MSNKNHTDSEIITQRLMYATESSTKTELSKKLGYKSVSGVTNWKDRGVDWNRVKLKFPTLSVDFLQTGEGKPFKNRSQNVSDSVQEAIDAVGQVKEEQGRYTASKQFQDDPEKLLQLSQMLIDIYLKQIDKK